MAQATRERERERETLRVESNADSIPNDKGRDDLSPKDKPEPTIILDFFAGSGTTAQAVMELNAEDGGNRQCILVTNNENNIAINVTYERIFRVCNGKGSNNEKIKWQYSKNKPFLNENLWDIFRIETHELKISNETKAKELLKIAKVEFKNLNENYESKDLKIYNDLASLNPKNKDNEGQK